MRNRWKVPQTHLQAVPPTWAFPNQRQEGHLGPTRHAGISRSWSPAHSPHSPTQHQHGLTHPGVQADQGRAVHVPSTGCPGHCLSYWAAHCSPRAQPISWTGRGIRPAQPWAPQRGQVCPQGLQGLSELAGRRELGLAPGFNWGGEGMRDRRRRAQAVAWRWILLPKLHRGWVCSELGGHKCPQGGGHGSGPRWRSHFSYVRSAQYIPAPS